MYGATEILSGGWGCVWGEKASLACGVKRGAQAAAQPCPQGCVGARVCAHTHSSQQGCCVLLGSWALLCYDLVCRTGLQQLQHMWQLWPL